MTKATHTPGPWETYLPHANDGWVCTPDGGWLAVAVGDNKAADARLIAESPAMLEALREAIVCSEQGRSLPPDWQVYARAILARIDAAPLQTGEA
ncbi:MAG: hypothetical protein K2Q27_05320 [Novosphingobium sp.]|nr:hypothetical protein [Novosphingobium sp.]